MSYSGTILGDSPKRYYRLGETTVTNGSSATDSSTSAQNGTYTGSDISSVAGLLSGDSDKAISFTSSSSSYVSVPTTGMSTGAGAWSMECWIKTPSSFTGTEPTIMMMGSTATNTGAFLIYEPTDQKIELWDWNGSVVNATSTTATSTIYYICATYDGTTAKLYIGTSGGSVSLQGSASKTYAIAYGTVTVGADRTSGDYWSGVIDEAAFYTVALTSTQVTAHFNAGDSSVTTSSRTVTSTVALKTSSSHAISASAALRVTFSRSVLSTVALAAIRTVSCSTALLTKQSRTASATATLLVTPIRTVGSNTAVILVTSKRSVTSTVALRQTDTRSIGATSAILVTSHRTITTRTALLQTDSRSVGAATNLLVTSKRAISSTATLSQPGATIRSVPAGVALLVTSQRTISNVATLLQTSTHTVSVHASLLVTSMRTISTTGVLKVTGASKAIPSTTSLKTLSNARSVSVHVALLQTGTRVVLASATLSTGRVIPCSVALKETFTRTIHATTTLTSGLPPASNAIVYVRSGAAQITVTSGQAIVHIR